MSAKKYNYFLVRQRDGELLKFCYDSQQGIYYQTFMNGIWSEKKNVYKNSFECFYVFQEWNGKINIFCQDICGDIILCTLKGIEWEYKTLLNMTCDVITPVRIIGFLCDDNIHLLYNIVDKYNYTEGLVHQISKKGTLWTPPEIISKLDSYSRVSYAINQDDKSNVIILNTMLDGVYQLISRSFHIAEELWGKEEIIHTSLLPYIDFTFCVEGDRSHYLFITQDNQINRVIYQYKEIGLQKNTILFEHINISSCVLILSDKILWGLWVCEDKLYRCFSIDFGKNFSEPEEYKYFDKEPPIKMLYQEYLEGNGNKYGINEIYDMNLHIEEQLFLHGILDSSVDSEIEENKNLEHGIENINFKEMELNNRFEEVEILKREEAELRSKLKSANEELTVLKNTMRHKKNQISNLRYKFYREKEKIKIYLNDNNILKEKNTLLEEKMISKDREKILIEKKVEEKEKENESLKQQIDMIKIKKLSNSKELKRKKRDDMFNQRKLSLVKWLFDDENERDI